MTEAGGVTMPAEQMGVVALDELVLHGWDLARATGQSSSCDSASTAAVLAFTKASAQPEEADNREGLFGPWWMSRRMHPRLIGRSGSPAAIRHGPPHPPGRACGCERFSSDRTGHRRRQLLHDLGHMRRGRLPVTL